MKKTLILISALLALALMLTGCAQNAPAPVPTDAPVATAAPTDAPTDAPTAAPTDAAESQPVSEKPGMLATINGKDIPIDEALKEYAYYEMMYTMYGYTAELEQLKKEIADYYIDLELIYLQFEALGMQADMDEVKAAAQANYQATAQSYTTYVTDKTLTDDQKLKAAEELMIGDGYDMAYFEQVAYNEARLTAVLEHYSKDINATEEDVKAYYDDLIASDKALYESNIAYYEQANSYGERVMYVPEGFRRVKHILVVLSDEDQSSLSTLTTKLKSLNASKNAEGADIEALNKSIGEVEAQIDAIYATIEPKVEEIMNKLAAGEDFAALMEAYGEDPGMKSEPYASEGYLVHADSAQWVAEFRDGAMALEQIGDISQPIRTSYGLHIIRYEGDVQSGAADYETVREELAAEVQDVLMNNYYNDLVGQWRAANEITVYLENFVVKAE